MSCDTVIVIATANILALVHGVMQGITRSDCGDDRGVTSGWNQRLAQMVDTCCACAHWDDKQTWKERVIRRDIHIGDASTCVLHWGMVFLWSVL